MKTYHLLWLVMIISLISSAACSTSDTRLVLATTTSTDDSGLLAEILPAFEAQSGLQVDVVAVGTGQALALGENGDADVLLVHARSREDAFVGAGYGVNRHDVMYNDFVLVGPTSDPAGVRGLNNVAEALSQIAQAESNFVSRGDNSGTHIKEQILWEATEVTLIEDDSLSQLSRRPDGKWYQSVGQGMGATLTVASEQAGYTLSDRATYLARYAEGLALEVMVEGDERLFNPYGVIAINPERHPDVNVAGATAFINWLTSLETQKAISQYGISQYGQPLFYPDSSAWRAAQN